MLNEFDWRTNWKMCDFTLVNVIKVVTWVIKGWKVEESIRGFYICWCVVLGL